MKKIIFSLATVALMATSCKTSPIEEVVVPNGDARKVIATTSVTSQTKIDIDENWKVSWSVKDTIGAYSTEDPVYPGVPFTTECEAGATTAEFEGEMAGNGIFFYYPYSKNDISMMWGWINGYSLTSQVVDMDKPYDALGTSAFMLSGPLEIVDDKIDDFTMDYVNAFVKINVLIQGLESGQSINISSAEITGLATSAAITPWDVPENRVVDPKCDGSIVVEISNSKDYVNGDIITLPIVAFPSDVEKISVKFDYELTKQDGTKAKFQTMECSTNEGGSATIERGKYNEVNVSDADFIYIDKETPVGKDFEIRNIKTSSNSITFDADINKERCAIVGVNFIDKASCSDPMKQWGSPQYNFDVEVREDGTYTISNSVYAGVDYYIYAVAVDDSNGLFEFEPSQGEVYECSTEAKEIGTGLTVAIEDVKPTLTDITVNFVRSSSSISSVFCGAVKKETLGESTITEYLDEINYVGKYNASSFENQDVLNMVLGFDITSKDLESETEYVVFAIGVGEDGTIGEVTSIECVTSLPKEDANVILEITPTLYGTFISVEIPAGSPYTQVAARIISENDSFSDTDLIEMLSSSAISTNGEYSYVDGSEKDMNSETGYIKSELWSSYYSRTDKYQVVLVAGDGSSKIGPLQKSEMFYYADNEFNSSASVTASLIGVTVKKNDWTTSYDVTADIQLGADAARCMYGFVNEDQLSEEDKDNVDKWGNQVVMSWGMSEVTQSGEVTINSGVTSNRLVFVPIDADGKYGTSVVIEWVDDIPNE